MDKNVKIMDKNHNDSDLEHEALVNMFSEIKEFMEEINNKPSASELTIPPEITTRVETILNEIRALRARNSFTPEQKEYLKFELANAVRDIAKTFGEKYSAGEQAIINQLKELKESLDSPQTMNHNYSFSVDFKNQRATATIIIMGLIILLSGGLNIWQVDKNSDLRDNDLKYRRVLMKDGATAEDLTVLQNMFGYNRDPKAIKQLRRHVEHYERLVKERAEKIEQARLDAARARQLHNEAEAIKKKR